MNKLLNKKLGVQLYAPLNVLMLTSRDISIYFAGYINNPCLKSK